MTSPERRVTASHAVRTNLRVKRFPIPRTSPGSTIHLIHSPGAAQPHRVLPMLALIAASVILGTSDVASKRALVEFPPITLAALRFTIAFLILDIMRRRAGQQSVHSPSVAALGLIGIVGVQLFQNFGLRWTGAADASLINGIAPALAALIAVRWLGERLSLTGVIGIGLSLSGVAIAALARGDQPHFALGGDLLILASVACFALFVVLGRQVFATGSMIAILSAAIRYALYVLVPAALIELWLLGPNALEGVGAPHLAVMLYLGAGCSAFTYALWGYALRYLEVGRAAIFDNLVPIVGIVAASLVLGEQLMPRHIAGAALVIGGVTLVAARPSRQRAPGDPTFHKRRVAALHSILPSPYRVPVVVTIPDDDVLLIQEA